MGESEPKHSQNPQEPSGIKKWILDGIGFCITAWSEPQQTWENARKDFLNMRGGLILVLIVAVALIFYSCGKRHAASPTQSPSVTTTSNTYSPVTQINQSSNVTVKNNSDNITIAGTNNQFSNQKFFGNFQGQMNFPANIGNLIINNPIYTNPPDTELRAFVTQINETATFASNGVLLSRSQLAYLTELLTKLNERTEDVQKLPDGRTSFGGIIGGASRVYGADRNNAIYSLASGNMHLALEQSQKSIEDFESCPSNFVNEMVNILPSSKAISYKVAMFSAGLLHSNELANDYALKLVGIDPNPTNKMYLVNTLGALAMQRHNENNYSNAFVLFQCAITNYESIPTNFPDRLTEEQAIELYGFAAQTAFMIGKTNIAIEYGMKAGDVLNKIPPKPK
jgi:tetratricopeptide (TPR) repeat protein